MNYLNKIIVFGFPHCGTSILKSIIGHISYVTEYYNERQHAPNDDYTMAVIKWSSTLDEFFEYNDYHKLFIIRNPLYVFSSLNRRFDYKIPEDHSFQRWETTAQKWLEVERNNLYKLKYEELFDSNCQVLRDIFDRMKLEYDYSIFANKFWTNKHTSKIDIESIETEPEETKHAHFRTWQINQELKNMNDPSKIALLPEQRKEIESSEMFKILYS